MYLTYTLISLPPPLYLYTHMFLVISLPPHHSIASIAIVST